MHRVLLVGGGKIGRTIARFLASTRDYSVRVVDADARALATLPDHPRISRVLADGTDRKALLSLLKDCDTVVSAPLYPTNALKYARTWSTDGLINEYCNPCDVITDGRRTEIPALEGLEELSIEGVRYEAFHTSGGAGTLPETLDGKVRELDFKTLRYPGHRDRMQFLLRDMRLSSRRELLRELLEQAIPTPTQDVVVVLCEARGMRGGGYEQLSDARKIYGRRIDGEDTSAIQITSAASLCVMLDLHVARLLPRQGFVRQEQVDLSVFLGSRFGGYFDAVRSIPIPRGSSSKSDLIPREATKSRRSARH